MKLTSEMLTEVLMALRSNPPASSDKRQQPRVGLRVQVQIILPPSAEPCSVRLRDISEGGIGLLTEMALDDGQELILLLQGKDGAPKFLRCAVTHCRKAGSSHYSVGASFQS
jgi:hypothetical protein